MYRFVDSAENAGSPEVQSEVIDISSRLLEVMDAYRPERGYIEHNERVLDIISDYAPEEMDTESGLMQHVVAVHDAVAHLHQNSKSIDAGVQKHVDEPAGEIMQHLAAWFGREVHNGEARSRVIVRNAIAVSISAELLEHKSSEWRERFFGSDKPHVTPELLRSRPGIVSLEELVEAIDEYDIEAFILKSAELIDNLRHPHQNSEVGQFEDAIELTSFYVPALEILGFDDLASLANDEALQYLNGAEYRGLISEARNRQAIAVQNCSGVINVIEHYLNEEVDSLDVSLGHRIKSVGSTLDKLRQLSIEASGLRLDEDVVAMSDQIGIRLVFESGEALKDLLDLDQGLQEHLLDIRNWQEIMPNVIGVELFHPRSEPKQRMVGAEARPNGYEAIHTTYRLHFGNGRSMNFEVQVLNREMHEYNSSAANHALYKTTHTESLLGNAIKKLKAVGAHQLEEHELQVFEDAIEMIKNAQSRAEFYRERERWMSRVNPRSVYRTARTLSNLPGGEVVSGSWAVLTEMCKHCDFDEAPQFSGFATEVSSRDFVQLLSDIRPDLFENDDTRLQLDLALDIAEEFHGDISRRTGTTALNGHILPAALAFAYDRALKDRFDFTPSEVDSICILLLHDFLEDIRDYPEHEDELDSFFRDMPDEVVRAVMDLTKPPRTDTNGVSSIERENLYIDAVARSGRLLEKFFDRAQNIYTDIDALAYFVDSIQAGPGLTSVDKQEFVDLYSAITRYWVKSQHLFNHLVLGTAIESPTGQILYDQSTRVEDHPTQMMLRQNLNQLFADYTALMTRATPLADRFAYEIGLN